MYDEKNKSDKKEPQPAKKTVKNAPNKSQEDFKRRYFEFYDDIKISDRQDW